jgi:hypothetical protein
MSLRDIEADDKHVGLAVDFNDVSRLQQSVKGTPTAAKPALDIAQRTFAPEIRKEFRTIVEIHPMFSSRESWPMILSRSSPNHRTNASFASTNLALLSRKIVMFKGLA